MDKTDVLFVPLDSQVAVTSLSDGYPEALPTDSRFLENVVSRW